MSTFDLLDHPQPKRAVASVGHEQRRLHERETHGEMGKWHPHPPQRSHELLSPGVRQEERTDEAEEVMRGDGGGSMEADGTAAGLAGGDGLDDLSDSFEAGPLRRRGGQEAPGSPWWEGGAGSASPRHQTNLGGEAGTAWTIGGQPHSAAEPAAGGALLLIFFITLEPRVECYKSL